jgi:hypothetical protein
MKVEKFAYKKISNNNKMTLHNQILEALQFLSSPEKKEFLPYFSKLEKENMRKVINLLAL